MSETPFQIAERIARHRLDSERVSVAQFSDIVTAFEAALDAERERALRLIDEHQALDVCNDNCWTTIKNAIRGSKQ